MVIPEVTRWPQEAMLEVQNVQNVTKSATFPLHTLFEHPKYTFSKTVHGNLVNSRMNTPPTFLCQCELTETGVTPLGLFFPHCITMDSSLVPTLKATIQCTGTANCVNRANSKQEMRGQFTCFADHNSTLENHQVHSISPFEVDIGSSG